MIFRYIVLIDAILSVVFLVWGFANHNRKFKIIGFILLTLFVLELAFVKYLLGKLNG